MKNDKLAWRYFPKIDSARDLENYIKYRNAGQTETAVYKNFRAYAHVSFCHYTKIKNLNKIFENNSFLLKRMGASNDPMEKELNENDYTFHFCFSTGINENLPLWYLYSGVDGKGVRLSLTGAKVYKLISEGTYELLEINEDNSAVENGLRLSLKKDIDFEANFQDVVYVKEKENDKFVDLKYNTMTNHNRISKDDFQNFKTNNKYFIKSLIWYYEKETRLVIKLNNEIAKKLDKSKNYAVKLSFNHLPEVIKSIKLTLSPEFLDDSKEESNEKIMQKLSEYKYIFKWLLNTSNCSTSEYTGQVKMNLCKNCNKNSSN